jgi:hypothetical protein
MSKTNPSPTFPMFPNDAVDVTPSDTVPLAQPSVLYVGGGGSVSVVTANGSAVTFTGLLPGSIIPVRVIQVYATGTSPTTGILAIF